MLLYVVSPLIDIDGAFTIRIDDRLPEGKDVGQIYGKRRTHQD